jgi:hypothetical protein
VDANVGINVPMEILQKKSHGANQQVKGQARVSSEMIAILNGPGFKIDLITPERQAIAEGFPTVWSWNVEARDAGDQELESTLYALVPNGETSLRQRVTSYSQTISVSVREQTWGEWLESSHGFDSIKAIVLTLSAIATAVLGWFGISWQRKKKGDATKENL